MSIKSKLSQGGDGTAIPAGMVGEVITQTGTITTIGANPGNVFIDLFTTSKTIPKGVWMVTVSGQLNRNGATGASFYFSVGLGTTTGNASFNVSDDARMDIGTGSTDLWTSIYAVSHPIYLNISSDTAYFAKGVIKVTTGTPTLANCRLIAVRIA